MATALTDLIDINLLTYYDEKIKAWIVNTLNEKTDGLELTTTSELPETGEAGKVYITEDAILTWDEDEQAYIAVGSADAAASTWTAF